MFNEFRMNEILKYALTIECQEFIYSISVILADIRPLRVVIAVKKVAPPPDAPWSRRQYIRSGLILAENTDLATNRSFLSIYSHK